MRPSLMSIFLRAFFALSVFAEATTAANATNRALLIGINHYAPAGVAPAVAATGHALDSRFAVGATWVNLEGPANDVASMRVLLQNNYQFTDIRVLAEEQATRAGILAAIDKLVVDTQPGDLIVFYFAGHGSQRRDTLSSKDHLDETIVPFDASAGATDIRDKELAARFNTIVYDKQARLTAIYDSCHSGTMARGITDSVQRTLPYDDRDVADEKKKDASTITEGDLKRIPQGGNAIILAAADSTQSAVEARYPEDHEFHGAFTRALVRVLQGSVQNLSADDVVAEISSMMHADKVPFQQPSVEGKIHASLFGPPVGAHSLHVHVTAVSGGKITLDVGSAGGFDVGTQFKALEAGAGGHKAQIEVTQVTEPLISLAALVADPVLPAAATVKVGQTFEMTSMTYPQAARLVIFASKAETLDGAGDADKIKAKFPGLTWVGDPALKQIDFLLVEGANGWIAYGQDGKQVGPGNAAKGMGYLLLGPAPALLDQIKQSPPFEHNSFAFTENLADADYLLGRRTGSGGKQEYTLFDRGALAPHKGPAYVTSAENDPDDTAFNGGTPPDVVCRNDVSRPVRTGWLPDDPAAGGQIVVALNRRIVRLGKLRVWLQSSALASGFSGWPYHLTITQPNSDVVLTGRILHKDQPYEVKLTATASDLATAPPIPKYGYLFGFDCAGDPFLLYPDPKTNGVARIPQPGDGGAYPPTVKLPTDNLSVYTPVGADTLFFMATDQQITNLSILLSDGVLDRSRGAGGGFEQLITDMADAGTRGPHTVPVNWLVQQLVIPSRP